MPAVDYEELARFYDALVADQSGHPVTSVTLRDRRPALLRSSWRARGDCPHQSPGMASI